MRDTPFLVIAATCLLVLTTAYAATPRTLTAKVERVSDGSQQRGQKPQPFLEGKNVEFWIPVILELVIGGVLVWLLVLYKNQAAFLRERISVLDRGQETLRSEASTLKTHTERLLALLDQLSPERLLNRMEVTEKLMEREWKAKLAESERELKLQIDGALGAKQTEEEKRKRLEEILRTRTKDLLEAATIGATVMWTFVPQSLRDHVVGAIKRDRVRNLFTVTFSTLSEDGPSPADRRPPGSALARILAEGPPPLPPASQGTVESVQTDVTPVMNETKEVDKP